jgi:ubiquinone/menaquinone biosynthesis C-methylase UbiE
VENKKAKTSVPNADFLVADAHFLPFRKGSFDLIILSLLLPYVEEDLALKECDRLLESGKLLLLRLHGLGVYLSLALTSKAKYDHNILNRLYLLLIIPFTILSWIFRKNLLHNMFQLKSRTIRMLTKRGYKKLKDYDEDKFLWFLTCFTILFRKGLISSVK